jgi:tocopherol O-methyltransferase
LITPRRPLAPGSVADHDRELGRHSRELWGEHVHHGLWRTGRETPAEAVEALTALVAREAAGVSPFPPARSASKGVC